MKKYLLFLIVFLGLLYGTQIDAQHICGTDEYENTMSIVHPPVTAAYVAHMQLPPDPDPVIYDIPVAVHVIYEDVNGPENLSDEEVRQAITILNDNFATFEYEGQLYNSGIRFHLAETDEDGDCYSGISRVQYHNSYGDVNNSALDQAIKGLSWRNSAYYLNIHVVKNVADGFRGYTPIGGQGAIDRDGVVIRYDYLMANDLAHEVGHWLNLFHTFQGSDTCIPCVERDNCSENGDKVCDTYPTDGTSNGCTFEAFPCSECTDEDTGAFQSDNYMTYTDCEEKSFTAGQVQRMRLFILEDRQSLYYNPDPNTCYNFENFYANDLDISETTSWTKDNLPNAGRILITGELRIKSGVQLTIGHGVEIAFGNCGKVIVERGAVLESHCTFTGACPDKKWEGISVFGNSGQIQAYNSPQFGLFNAHHGTVIENALIGVKLSGNDAYLNGGILDADQATFRNNETAIKVLPYNIQLMYQGRVKNCTFESDVAFDSFIDLTGVNGYSVEGSTFINHGAAGGKGMYGYGYGIWAKDAGIDLSSTHYGGGSPDPNAFFKLDVGIYLQKVGFSVGSKIEQATFSGCYTGIYNYGMSDNVLTFNTFYLGSVPDPSQIPLPEKGQIGIMNEGFIAGMTCQQNKFIHGSDDLIGVGIINQRLGNFNNIVRNNEFYNNQYATLSTGINSIQLPNGLQSGLLYFCNNFNGKRGFDMALTKDAGYYVRINVLQGLFTGTRKYEAAGNLFSTAGSGHLYNEGSTVHTYLYGTEDPRENPQIITGSWEKSLTDEPNNLCEALICPPPCKEGPGNDTIVVVDDGDKWAKAKEKYDKLCVFYIPYPYNEDPVTYTGVIPPPIADTLNGLRQQMDRSIHKVLASCDDGVHCSEDQILWWLEQIDTYGGDLRRVRYLRRIGRSSEAQTVLAAIPTRWSLTGARLEEYRKWVDIYNMTHDRGWTQLNAGQRTILESYAELTHHESGRWARSILHALGQDAPITYYLPNDLGTRESEEGMQASRDIYLYPNPTLDELYIHHGSQDHLAELVLHDRDGRAMRKYSIIGKRSLSVDDLTPGVYIATIYDDKQMVVTRQKIVIIR